MSPRADHDFELQAADPGTFDDVEPLARLDSREELVMVVMRGLAVLLTLLLIFLSGCKNDDVVPGNKATVRLARGADGLIHLEIRGADRSPRAVQVELTGEGSDTVLMEDAAAPDGRALDTVRIQMQGTSTALLFVSDKRPVLLPRDGELAKFRVRSTSGGAPDARLRVSSALVVDEAGAPIDVELAPAIALR